MPVQNEIFKQMSRQALCGEGDAHTNNKKWTKISVGWKPKYLQGNWKTGLLIGKENDYLSATDFHQYA